jgi:acyl transferase domain-containing protein
VFYASLKTFHPDELSKDTEQSRINEAEFSQPLCTAVQIALVNLLRSWGVSPAAIVGHSSGEIAAAYACGAITATEAITLAYYRGLITKERPRAGGMAAIGLGRKETEVFLVNGVVIACENSPSSVTISGDQEALNDVCSRIKEELPQVFVQHLKVEMAYHSRRSHCECECFSRQLTKIIRPHA